MQESLIFLYSGATGFFSLDFLLDFSLTWLFSIIQGWFIFFFFFEKITLFIFRHKTKIPISLVEINYGFTHGTGQSARNTPFLRGYFTPSQWFPADKKKYAPPTFEFSYFNTKWINEEHLVYLPCKICEYNVK